MNFIKRIFGFDKKAPIRNNQDFWDWFKLNEKSIYSAIKAQKNVEKNALNPIMSKLQLLNEHFFCQMGMENDSTAELIITAEGDIKSFVFVEELINDAPKLPNWIFTALKPSGSEGLSIKMDGYISDKDNIHFFSNIHEEYPDDIDITLFHKDLTEQNRKSVANGAYIYLECLLGELNTATLIDSIKVEGIPQNNIDLVPLEKLPDFLKWREKEFVEKYEEVYHSDEEDEHSILEANIENDKGIELPLIAIINTTLLYWDAKASHPWMMMINIEYDGNDNNGMPDSSTYELMSQLEDEISKNLLTSKGYLNLGRQTYNNTRTFYWACKEFRYSSKIASLILKKYDTHFKTSYDIFKDKYWVTMNRFIQNT